MDCFTEFGPKFAFKMSSAVIFSTGVIYLAKQTIITLFTHCAVFKLLRGFQKVFLSQMVLWQPFKFMIAGLHLSGLRLFVTNLSPDRMQIGLQETGYGNKKTNSKRRGEEGFGELPPLMCSHCYLESSLFTIHFLSSRRKRHIWEEQSSVLGYSFPLLRVIRIRYIYWIDNVH